MTAPRNLGRLLELLFVAGVEVLLYRRFQQGDGTFHYFTHFFSGASLALVLMALVAHRRRRQIRLPLLAVLAGHLFAMAPDILYLESIAHTRWMDVFVAHNTSHFLPGRNISWYVVFVTAVTLYLITAPTSRETAEGGRHRRSPGSVEAGAFDSRPAAYGPHPARPHTSR